MSERIVSCAHCGAETADGIASVHRDGFGVGPEVPLCATCGSVEGPSLAEIWDNIAQPSDDPFSHRKLTEAIAGAGGTVAQFMVEVEP